MTVLDLVVDLIDALAGAHSPRALDAALARTLARYPAPLRDEPAVARVIAAGRRHVEVVQRVAGVSRRAHGEARQLRAALERVAPAGTVARSAAMRDALARAELVARHPTTVLLSGESGAGKEVLARAIHRGSPRAHRAFVALDCGAIPEALVESELFGHERGAFTGAERAHAGAFERAHRGTLLLDEIGELPRAAQAKLLRVLQERRVRRVGGESELGVDVRVLAATNRSLGELVEQGVFRRDLYYRLAVFEIVVPPLRDRRDDLALLASELLRELAADLGVPAPPLARAQLAQLAAYDWPGNVRELRNVLETALVLGGGTQLELPELPAPRRRPTGGSPLWGPTLDDAMRAAIEHALRASRGKLYGRDGAAARLGVPPTTLQSKLRKLGMRRSLPDSAGGSRGTGA